MRLSIVSDMLAPWLSCLPAMGRGLFLAAQVLTGLQLSLATAGVVWRGIRTLTHHRLQYVKSSIPGPCRRVRRKNGKKSATSRSKISLRTIWKNKSSASKKRRLTTKDSYVGMFHLGSTAQPKLNQTRKLSSVSSDNLNFSGLAEVTLMPDHDMLEGDVLLDLLEEQGPLPALAIVSKTWKKSLFFSVVTKTSLGRFLEDCCIESPSISNYRSWIVKTEAESYPEDIEGADVTRSWEEEYHKLVSWREKNSLRDEDEAMEDRTTWVEKLALDIVIEIIESTFSVQSKKHLAILDQWGSGRWHQVGLEWND